MAQTDKFTYVSDENVKTYLEENLQDLIKGIEEAFSAFSKGDAGGIIQPVRSTVPVDDYNGFFMSMPVYSRPHHCLAVKLISVFPDTTGHIGHVLYFEPNTGILKAIIRAEWFSIIRTTAATAAAIKHLSPENVSKLAVIGCGNEGSYHAKILKHVRNFTEIRLWNRTKARAVKVAEEVGGIACDTVEEAVKDADVIVTATLSAEPVLMGKWVKKGALINVIGGVRPHWRETDDDLMKSSQVFADSKSAVMVESGDVIMSGVEVVGEVGDVINGVLKPDFSRNRVFKSQGMAVEDAVAARIIYDATKGKES